MTMYLRFASLILLALVFAPSADPPARAQTLRGTVKLEGAARQLLDASRAARVRVNPEEVFSVSRGAETFAVAPIAGWERVAAPELRKGVDVAFAYFDTLEPKVPRGFYTVRAYADVSGVGTIPARLQLIDRRGRVAAELPAEAEVHSLTVPREAASLRTFVTTTHDRSADAARPIPGVRPRVWLRCPNGTCLRWAIFEDRNVVTHHQLNTE